MSRHRSRRVALKSELEARLLRQSIIATFLIAALGIVLGAASGSLAIVFDGFFSLIDAAITWLMLLVARLVAHEGDRRFQYGYWHLEPLVLALKSSVLLILIGFALFGAAGNLMAGGYSPKLGIAIVYAVLTLAVSAFMSWWLRTQNERIGSELVRIDNQAWLASMLLTGTLLASFIISWLIRGTDFAWLIPRIDPSVLILITLVMLPVPAIEAGRAFREIFEISPPLLDRQVRDVVGPFVEKKGFLRFTSYVSKVGRARFIEISILVPPGLPALPVSEFDRMRREIGDAIGGEGPERWLTITFTEDPAQM